MTLYAGIEAGGTKFVLGLGSAEQGSLVTHRVETRDPDETFAEIARFFAEHPDAGRIESVGIASFGPLDLRKASPTYGQIVRTPKPGWSGVDLVGRFGAMLGKPVAIDTDVNAAAIAESRLGAGTGKGDLAYVTIGTGIGVGLVTNGQPVHGQGHPEVGHILIRRHPDHRHFAGVCPFHGDCLEGLASGTAIRAAWGRGLDELPPDHPAWAVEADAVAQLCATLILTVSPETIVLGGGVMAQAALFPAIRARTATLLAGYLADVDEATLADRIVPPGCDEAPGLIGAYLLAAGVLTPKD